MCLSGVKTVVFQNWKYLWFIGGDSCMVTALRNYYYKNATPVKHHNETVVKLQTKGDELHSTVSSCPISTLLDTSADVCDLLRSAMFTALLFNIDAINNHKFPFSVI